MDSHRKNRILNNLMLGKTKIFLDKTYIVETPTLDVLQESGYIYDKIHKENRFAGWLSNDLALSYLLRRKICVLDVDKNLEILSKSIDDKKVGLYFAHWQNQQLYKQLRNQLKVLKKSYIRQFNTRHFLDKYTIDGYASKIQEQFVYYKSIFHEDGTLVWDDFDNVDIRLLDKILGQYFDEQPTEEECRFLARNEPWRSCWTIKGIHNFRIIENSQRNLILYTKMYENAYQHPDCPSNKIIDDDDLFDGWLIQIKRKNDKDKKDNIKESVDMKHPNASEIFIPVANAEEALEVNSFNDVGARIAKKKREAQLNAQEK